MLVLNNYGTTVNAKPFHFFRLEKNGLKKTFSMWDKISKLALRIFCGKHFKIKCELSSEMFLSY